MKYLAGKGSFIHHCRTNWSYVGIGFIKR